MTRVAMVGFDAAELDLVEPMLDEGKLPNLARMREQGVWARLDDSLAYRHGTIFPQFLFDRRAALGADWEDIGFDGSTYVAYQRNASMYGARVPFFNRTADRTTIAFDVPAMCLGHAPRAVEVIGWGASAPRYPRTSRPTPHGATSTRWVGGVERASKCSSTGWWPGCGDGWRSAGGSRPGSPTGRCS